MLMFQLLSLYGRLIMRWFLQANKALPTKSACGAFRAQCRHLIDNPLPFEGRNIRIPIKIS